MLKKVRIFIVIFTRLQGGNVKQNLTTNLATNELKIDAVFKFIDKTNHNK